MVCGKISFYSRYFRIIPHYPVHHISTIFNEYPRIVTLIEANNLQHITGSRDGPPVKVGVAVTDLTTGLYTSNSIMAALIARGRSGRGQHIDVALSDCQVATLANIASSCLISGEKDAGRWGTAHREFHFRSFRDHGFWPRRRRRREPD